MAREKELDLVAQNDYPVSGVSFNPDTMEANDPKQQGLLDSQNASDEYEGMSPLAMGLLQAGASMMRQGGWRNTPMTTGEAIGNAIPAGISGYYNQDMMNQQGEAEFYERQQAEEQARQAKGQARQQAKILEDQQKQEQAQIKQALDVLDRIPTKMIRPSAKDALRWQLKQGGESAQNAMKEIVTLTTKEEADKFGDVEFGTWGKGHANSLKLIEKQGLTAPDGAVDLNILPVKSGEKVIGYKTEWLNDNGLPITESKEDKEAKGYRYIDVRTPDEKIAFSKEFGNMPIADDANTMIVDKNSKVESYINTAGKTYDFSMDLTERAVRERKLAKEVNVRVEGFRSNSKDKRIAEWFNEDGTSKINIPEGTVNVKILTDGDIQFLGADNQPIDLRTMVIARYNETTKNYDNVLINKDTGKKIKELGISKAYTEPKEVWQHNIDKTEKEIKRKNFDAYLADIQKSYGIPDGQIKEWKLLAGSDFEKALSSAESAAKFASKALDVVKSGKQLNERKVLDPSQKTSATFYDEDRFYKQADDGSWAEFDPASSTRFAGENSIRKEYNQLTRDHRIASRGYDGIMSGLKADSGFGDIMAITSFRIMFEPNSVVREAEFEITSKAGGWLESFLNNPDQFMDGDRLSDTARSQMHSLVQTYMKAIKVRSDQHHTTFTKIGLNRGFENDGIVDPFKNHDFDIDFKTYKSTGESDGIKSTIDGNSKHTTLVQHAKAMIAKGKNGRK
tara:strand:- start:6689 stop:8893 length:2205 start_codon:yes stop_codon:yes gene_type:complete